MSDDTTLTDGVFAEVIAAPDYRDVDPTLSIGLTVVTPTSTTAA